VEVEDIEEENRNSQLERSNFDSVFEKKARRTTQFDM